VGGVRLVDGQLLPAAGAGWRRPGHGREGLDPSREALARGGDGRVGIETTVVETIYLGTATNYVLEAPGDVRLIVIAQNTDVATATDRLGVATVRTAWLGRITRECWRSSGANVTRVGLGAVGASTRGSCGWPTRRAPGGLS